MADKALTLQAIPASTNEAKPHELVSRQGGFSLHAGVACKSTQRKKLERLSPLDMVARGRSNADG